VIGLTAVVKDETDNLERWLNSVRPLIGYYAIMDTGSTDGTPEAIKEMMGGWGIDGDIHHCEFDYLGRHRQEILDLAYESHRADYLITSFDADEEFKIKGSFDTESLKDDCYYMAKYHGNVVYKIPVFLKADKPRWNWREPVHSYLQVDGTSSFLDNIYIYSHPQSGARSHGLTQEQKFLRDAKLLEAELKKNPKHPRNQFYLAQSYRDAYKYDRARKHYIRRVKMDGGFIEEIYVSLLWAARCKELGEKIFDWEGLVNAHANRPTRIESLFDIVRYCRINNYYWLGYAIGKEALKIPYPNDILFVEKALWDWRLKDEFSLCAGGVGNYMEAAEACREILGCTDLPDEARTRIENNWQILLGKVQDPIFVINDTLPKEGQERQMVEAVETKLQSMNKGLIT